jgi:hypothetical protein
VEADQDSQGVRVDAQVVRVVRAREREFETGVCGSKERGMG